MADITVTVQTSEGMEYPFTINVNQTVQELKQMICDQYYRDKPTSYLRLFISDNLMTDHSYINSYHDLYQNPSLIKLRFPHETPHVSHQDDHQLNDQPSFSSSAAAPTTKIIQEENGISVEVFTLGMGKFTIKLDVFDSVEDLKGKIIQKEGYQQHQISSLSLFRMNDSEPMTDDNVYPSLFFHLKRDCRVQLRILGEDPPGNLIPPQDDQRLDDEPASSSSELGQIQIVLCLIVMRPAFSQQNFIVRLPMVSTSYTIGNLKQRILDEVLSTDHSVSYTMKSFKVVFRGTLLDNEDLTLFDYGIVEDEGHLNVIFPAASLVLYTVTTAVPLVSTLRISIPAWDRQTTITPLHLECTTVDDLKRMIREKQGISVDMEFALIFKGYELVNGSSRLPEYKVGTLPSPSNELELIMTKWPPPPPPLPSSSSSSSPSSASPSSSSSQAAKRPRSSSSSPDKRQRN